jgi:hypothetical protein
MVTANIGGSTSPCMKRQNTSADSVGAIAAIKVGRVTTSIAVTITRLRPSTSETVPVNGAISATASVPAVTMAETCAALAENSVASSGRMACGEYRLMKQQKPARNTAKCRVDIPRPVVAAFIMS